MVIMKLLFELEKALSARTREDCLFSISIWFNLEQLAKAYGLIVSSVLTEGSSTIFSICVFSNALLPMDTFAA